MCWIGWFQRFLLILESTFPDCPFLSLPAWAIKSSLLKILTTSAAQRCRNGFPGEGAVSFLLDTPQIWHPPGSWRSLRSGRDHPGFLSPSATENMSRLWGTSGDISFNQVFTALVALGISTVSVTSLLWQRQSAVESPKSQLNHIIGSLQG